nr:hypothetical protein GCM10020185_00430 [Pseudomonas brassicacearum subsp. brassicacearum]
MGSTSRSLISQQLRSSGLLTLSKKSLDRLLSKEKNYRSAEKNDALSKKSKIGQDLASLADCDVVIEAATEDLELKLALMAQLDTIVRPEAIFGNQHIIYFHYATGFGNVTT